MIYTVQPQRYGDPELGLFDTIYLEAHSPVWTDKTALSPKTFQPTVRFSVSMYRMINEKLTFWKKNDAIYKQETWLAKFGNITPNDFKAEIDKYMIEQIVWVNNHQWTGDEMQVAGYWKESITDATGLAVYTPPPAPPTETPIE